jgi:cytochrome c1
MGSKVTADWLYDWLRQPRHYDSTTVMPDLRLTEQEAADITAYLLQGRDPAWEALPEPQADDAILDSIAVEYLAPLSSEARAREQVAQMRVEGGAQELEQYVGSKLFARYGCSGCHIVPGHQDDLGMCTELTKEGLKELTKFDFGFEASHHNPLAIPFTRHDWFRAKLRNPRVFDRMPVIEERDGESVIVRYDQKVKPPGDKLKMPNYDLSEEEVELLTQFLMGLRDDGIDPTMKRTLSVDEQVVEQGSRLITERNCTGCHQMGQLSAPLAEVDEDSLYAGYWMAQPLVADGRQVLDAGDWLQDEIYDPWEEWDADTLEFIEEHPLEGPVVVYGQGEGAMGSYIEQPAMRPPVLRGEGAKVQPDWLFDFLIAPYIVRTHVNVRMPTFGLTPEQSTALVRWFAARADQPWPFELDDDSVVQPELLDAGEAAFDKNQCNSCHPAGGVNPSNPDMSNWGPDLSIAAERLKNDWIHEWLKDPQGLQPGTKMPSFFGETVDGEYNGFVEDWQQQIRELQHYMWHMDVAEQDDGPVSMGDG